MADKPVDPLESEYPAANPPRATDLLQVLDISRSLAMTTDLQTLMKQIEQAARQVLDCERATVFVHDAGSDELYTLVMVRQESIRIPANRGIAGACFCNREVMDIQDAYTDPRFDDSIDRKTGFRTRNLLAAPLFVNSDQVLGVLETINKSSNGFNPSDKTLLQTFAAQAAISIHHHFLMQEYGKKQRLQAEMEAARKIQQSLLPSGAPQIQGYEIAGWNRPADATGGDYYDFQRLHDGRVLLVIADVTGHGIGPALLAAQCSALHRAFFSVDSAVDQKLNQMNRLLCKDIPADHFVTAFFALLEPDCNRFSYLSAGHSPVLLYRASEDSLVTLPVQQLPLGILVDADYTQWNQVELEPGDILAGLTDGFPEAENIRGEAFGLNRLRTTIRDNTDCTAAELIRCLHRALVEFSADVAQMDDLSAVVVRRPRD